MTHEDRLIEAVARAINRAAFSHHGSSDAEEEHFWRETKAVRLDQARAAVAAYRSYDERR